MKKITIIKIKNQVYDQIDDQFRDQFGKPPTVYQGFGLDLAYWQIMWLYEHVKWHFRIQTDNQIKKEIQ